MKAKLFSVLSLYTFLTLIFTPYVISQDSTQSPLPEGVKTRLGKGIATRITFSPDNTEIAVGSSVGLWIYDAKTHQEKSLLTGPGMVLSIAYSSDGTTLASGYRNGEIRLWDTHTRKLKQSLKKQTKPVYSLTYSPDSTTLASGYTTDRYDRDRVFETVNIHIWNANTGEVKHSINGDMEQVMALAYSSDGTILASGTAGGIIKLWDVETGQLKRTHSKHTHAIYSLAYSLDGKTLACGYGGLYRS